MGNYLKLHKKFSLTIVLILVVLLLFDSYLSSSLTIRNRTTNYSLVTSKEDSKVIFVPDDYTTIQEAVNAANGYDIIIVRDGIYIENVEIHKTVVIVSENGPNSTIVQAKNIEQPVFTIEASFVNLTGFTIKDAVKSAGILIDSSGNIISNNIVVNNTYGIRLEFATRYNTIFNNTIRNNTYGIYNSGSESNNFYLNCLINSKNYYTRYSLFSKGNSWSSPKEITYYYEGRNYTSFLGNFWSDYDGEDVDNDGIGDTPYEASKEDVDYFPLIGIWINKTIIFVDVTPPSVIEIIISPECPKAYEDVRIAAKIVDKRSGVKKATLYYSVNDGEWIKIEMVEKNGYWITTIPGQPGGSFLKFFIETVDSKGNVGRSYTRYYEIPGFPTSELLIAIILFVITFSTISFFRKIQEREEEFFEIPEDILDQVQQEEEGGTAISKVSTYSNGDKKRVIEPLKIGEEEKRILFDLESEKMALEDLITDLNRKFETGKIDFLEYSKLFKEYRKELHLIEKKLMRFKLKLGLIEHFRCMVCGLEIMENEDIVFCPYCKNPAHRDHLLEWLHIKGICPNCRRFIRREDLT